MRFIVGLPCIPTLLHFRGGFSTCNTCGRLLLWCVVVELVVIVLSAHVFYLSSRWERLWKFRRFDILDLVMDGLYLLWDLVMKVYEILSLVVQLDGD